MRAVMLVYFIFSRRVGIIEYYPPDSTPTTTFGAPREYTISAFRSISRQETSPVVVMKQCLAAPWHRESVRLNCARIVISGSATICRSRTVKTA
jgi:hypothetical protein